MLVNAEKVTNMMTNEDGGAIDKGSVEFDDTGGERDAGRSGDDGDGRDGNDDYDDSQSAEDYSKKSFLDGEWVEIDTTEQESGSS